MDTNQHIIEISSEIGSIQKFCSLVNAFHNLTKCAYPQCNIRSFNEILREVVFENKNKSYEDTRTFFIWTYIQNPELFQSI